MKRASALLKSGKVFLQGYSETTAGVWIAAGPVFVASANELRQLRNNIIEAMQQSTRGIPHPSQAEWKEIQGAMLRAVGAKTWSALAKGSKVVGLECSGNDVTMIPSISYENHGGTAVPELSFTSHLSADDIGSKLRDAFAACR